MEEEGSFMEGIAGKSRSLENGGRGLGRREFLVLSAAGILIPWLGRAAEAATPLGGAAPIVAPAVPMSVGYVEGSDAWKSLRRLPWDDVQAAYAAAAGGVEPPRSPVVSANDMPLGNQNLASTVVKVTVLGLYPAVRKKETVDAIDLDVFFPSPDPAFPKPLPFHAWSFRRLPGLNVGHRLSFNVPLGLAGELVLSLVVGEPGAAVRRRYDASFTVDPASGRPKLQRGIYLLGLGPAVWKGEAILPAYGEKARLDLRSLVISIDDKPKKPRRKKVPAPAAAPVG
jgi:hypothetical protein